LRADNGEWCLINEGSPPAVVMGVSAKPHQHVAPGASLPLIRRFSGGGTVVVDENTHFITLICNSGPLEIDCFPCAVHRFAETFYKELHPGISLRENDYVIGDRKFGGNAQYMRKGRFLHHSSLLWDYDPARMELLKMPPKMPGYRQNRPHAAFLCRLKEHLPSRAELEERFLEALSGRFSVKEVSLKEAGRILSLPHRKSTLFLGK